MLVTGLKPPTGENGRGRRVDICIAVTDCVFGRSSKETKRTKN
jgi:hypothetical protein